MAKRIAAPGEADKLIAHQSRLLKARGSLSTITGSPSKAAKRTGRWKTI